MNAYLEEGSDWPNQSWGHEMLHDGTIANLLSQQTCQTPKWFKICWTGWTEVGAVRKTTIQPVVDENMCTVFESDQGRAGQIPQRLTQSCVPVQRPSTSSGSCAKIAFPTHQLPEHPQLDAKWMAQKKQMESLLMRIHLHASLGSKSFPLSTLSGIRFKQDAHAKPEEQRYIRQSGKQKHKLHQNVSDFEWRAKAKISQHFRRHTGKQTQCNVALQSDKARWQWKSSWDKLSVLECITKRRCKQERHRKANAVFLFFMVTVMIFMRLGLGGCMSRKIEDANLTSNSGYKAVRMLSEAHCPRGLYMGWAFDEHSKEMKLRNCIWFRAVWHWFGDFFFTLQVTIFRYTPRPSVVLMPVRYTCIPTHSGFPT